MSSSAISHEYTRKAVAPVDVFFYSYYQDAALLRARGAVPRQPRSARLRGWSLRLGQYSNIVRAPGDSVWGTMFSLTHEEIDLLYRYPGVPEYLPRPVLVDREWGPVLPALCFVLRDERDDGVPNPEYVANLRRVMLARGLPVDALERTASLHAEPQDELGGETGLRGQLAWLRRAFVAAGNPRLAACQCETAALVRRSRDPNHLVAVFCAYAFLDQFVYTYFRRAHASFRGSFVGPTLKAHGSGGRAHPFWLLDARGHGLAALDEARVKALFESLVAEGVAWLATEAGVSATESTAALHRELDGSFLQAGLVLDAGAIAARAAGGAA